MLAPFTLIGVPTGVPFRFCDNINANIYYRFSEFPVVGHMYRCFRYDSLSSKETRLVCSDTVVFVEDDYFDMCQDIFVDLPELF
jgi:hypothetical protein